MHPLQVGGTCPLCPSHRVFGHPSARKREVRIELKVTTHPSQFGCISTYVSEGLVCLEGKQDVNKFRGEGDCLWALPRSAKIAAPYGHVKQREAFKPIEPVLVIDGRDRRRRFPSWFQRLKIPVWSPSAWEAL